MGWLIFAIILVLVAAFFAFVLIRNPSDERGHTHRGFWASLTSGALLLAAGALFLGSFYTVGVGEAMVLKSVTGRVVGFETTAGAHLHAPWVSTVTYDIRNQQIVYSGKGEKEADHSGGTALGAQITVQDADGVSSNIDIAVRYSINPTAVKQIYREYGDQQNFTDRLITQDIRSVVRAVPSNFHTLSLLTDRSNVESEIQKQLSARWEKSGVIVDSVALQEIRVPNSVKVSYAQAQQAQINVEKAKANLEATRVSAQQKVVQAKAEADANRTLSKSLSDKVLKQRYLDTLGNLGKAGNLVVVPDGFNGLVNVSGK